MLELLLSFATLFLAPLSVPLQVPAGDTKPADQAQTAEEQKAEEAAKDAMQTEADQKAEAAAKDAMAPEKFHKTAFKNLRFDENWSALKDPEMKTDHWMPGIKAIQLDGDGDWTASFGGQLRYQWKSEENRNLLGGPVPHNNDFSLLRVRLYGEMKYREDFRVFIETISAGIHANDAAPLAIDRQDFDLLNGFIEFTGQDVLGRVGRFEMQYGAQRLVSPLEWANTRRTFQGGLFRTKDESMTTDVFVTRPIEIDPHHSDDSDHDRWFSGVYNTWKLAEGEGLDLYGLSLNDSNDLPSTTPAGGPPTFDGDIYTAGARYFGKQGGLDYELEAAKQFGNRAGADVDAYMWTAVSGYTLADCPTTPRFAVDVDYASGDSSPGDGDFETFNQLYPLAHAYFGFIDLVGRQNIFSIMPSVTMKTTKTTTFRVSYSDFTLATDNDFLYNASGAVSPGQGAATLNTGDDVGQEVDLTLAWKPTFISPHGEFLFGYSWFEPGDFVEDLPGGGEDTKLLYLQYLFTF